jgi:hypothetical protein
MKLNRTDQNRKRSYSDSIPDGMHYQITLQRPSDMNDQSTWCRTAAFSDDRGVIFLGQAIDCEAAPR